MRSSAEPCFVSIRSTEPRRMKRSSIRTGSRWLRSSRPSSARPKLYSKYSGVHGADSGSLRIHTRRSRPIAAISSRQTRSIAGASRSLSADGGDVERRCERSGARAARRRASTAAACRRAARAARGPALRGRATRASADRAAAAAPAARSARSDRSPTARTGTGRSRTSGAPRPSTGARPAAACRASA